MSVQERLGWVLYDGRCPICRREARRLAHFVGPIGYASVPLQRRWVTEALAARSEPAPDALLLLLPDGCLLAGVDALLHLGRQVAWTRPLAWCLSLSSLRPVLRHLYAWVARNRYVLSRLRHRA